MQKENLTPELQELQNALSALTPTTGRYNRDELFFQAGRTSAQKRPIFWPALSVLLAVTLAISWLYHPAPTIQDRVQIVRVTKEVPAMSHRPFHHYSNNESDETNAMSYIALRDNILSNGLDILDIKPDNSQVKPLHNPQSQPLTRWNWQILLDGESS